MDGDQRPLSDKCADRFIVLCFAVLCCVSRRLLILQLQTNLKMLLRIVSLLIVSSSTFLKFPNQIIANVLFLITSNLFRK